MKECLFYTKLEGGAVRCALCPHSCLIKPGGRGLCRSRINRDGSLYSEAYGRPCALAIDPIEKKPLYHFHPGEECLSLACTGCNLRCKGCQNHDISQVKPTEANCYQLSPEELIAAVVHRKSEEPGIHCGSYLGSAAGLGSVHPIAGMSSSSRIRTYSAYLTSFLSMVHDPFLIC